MSIRLKALTLDGFTQVFLDILLQSQAPGHRTGNRLRREDGREGNFKWKDLGFLKYTMTSSDPCVGAKFMWMIVKICWRRCFKQYILINDIKIIKAVIV